MKELVVLNLFYGRGREDHTKEYIAKCSGEHPFICKRCGKTFSLKARNVNFCNIQNLILHFLLSFTSVLKRFINFKVDGERREELKILI